MSKLERKILKAVFAFLAVMFVCMVAYSQLNAADITYSVINSATKKLRDMGDGTWAEVVYKGGEPKVEAAAGYFWSGIDADKVAVLIDLSDATNYAHTATNEITLRGYQLSALATGAQWRLRIGYITSIDGSGSTVSWVFSDDTNAVTNQIANFNYKYSGDGFPLTIVAGVSTTYNGNIADLSFPAVTLTADLDSPEGTVNAGVGDIVIYLDELSGSNTFSGNVIIFYGTE